MDLNGKSVLVTGASSGIGERIAIDLGARGARLTLVARREERLQEIASRVVANGGESPLVVVADMRNEDAILAAFARCESGQGGLDVLINNAGLGRWATWHEGATEDWREMLEVNTLALTIATREALQRFPSSGGHIVNISSMAAHRVPPGGGFYSATKYFVRAMTESLRMELRARGSRTRVSSISPGFVKTEFHDVYYKGDREALNERYPDYRVLDAADVSSAVVYVLEAPEHVAVHDVLMRSNEQPS